MWYLRRWHGNKPNLRRKSEWLIPTLHQPYPVFMHSLGKKLFSIYKIQKQKRMVFWCKFKAHTSSYNMLKNLSKNGRESMLDTLIMTYLFWITSWLLMERPSHLGQVQSCLLLKSPGSSPENFISYSKCKSWTDMLDKQRWHDSCSF